MKPSPKTFQNQIWDFYRTHERDMPWRINTKRSARTVTPYHILVSELMLQQTQVPRVIPKYKAFIRQFPTFKALAEAPTGNVISAWKGLGYNRRAINLKRTAKIVTDEYRGKLPEDEHGLLSFPGIGSYTAGALLAFAFNKPVALIETNVRTVYLHTYFPGQTGIADSELMPLIEKTLDQESPREWYYALMDYGTHLKESGINLVSASKHYTKQTPFRGSNRETRSKILEYILQHKHVKPKDISLATKYPLTTIKKNLQTMTKEGLIQQIGETYTIAS